MLTPTTLLPFCSPICALQYPVLELILSSPEEEPVETLTPRKLAPVKFKETSADYLATHAVTLAWRARLELKAIQRLPPDQQLFRLRGFLIDLSIGNGVAERVYQVVTGQPPYTRSAEVR